MRFLDILVVFGLDLDQISFNLVENGRVVRAPDLKSVGRGFKSRSDR